PVFMRRVDREDRGREWSAYLRETSDAAACETSRVLAGVSSSAPGGPYVRLTDFDTDGELKVLAAAMYAHAALDDAALLEHARRLPLSDRARVLEAYVGNRSNRPHRPGR